MADPTRPQLYLVTPPAPDMSSFPNLLERVLDRAEPACLRLALASHDADTVARTADRLREIAHARDIACVLDRHVALAARLGLDGVHLTDGSRGVRAARKELGADAIVGSFCGTSSHDGMTAAEAGADYVAFGPVGGSALGDGQQAGRDLFAWWSEMIELPVVAEGALTPALVADLAPATDFLALGEEIWATDDPAATLAAFTAALG